jgi:hypothetical protein
VAVCVRVSGFVLVFVVFGFGGGNGV